MAKPDSRLSIEVTHGIATTPAVQDDAGDTLPASGGGGVRISWARLDDALVNVRNVPDEATDRCKCLECGNAMVARRGSVRKWHFAHAPGTPPCPLQSEEVLRRFEAKMHIHGLLQDLRRLSVLVTCRSRRGSQADHIAVAHDWVEGWDAVHVNASANGGEPDLVLIGGDQLLAAIEVRGSTAVGPGKEARLTQIGVPWVEVLVDEALRWDQGVPLNVYRLEPEGWFCPICSAHRQASRNRAPQCEVHESRLDELRQRGLLRTLWTRRFHASHQDRLVILNLEICDLLDARGLPLHRLMVDVGYGYVMAGVTVKELVSDVEMCRRRLKESVEDWRTSLNAVGIKVSEKDPKGWKEVGNPNHLYDTEEARRRLRAMLQELARDPAVDAACLVLGVNYQHSLEELKTARRQLAKSWHPDIASPNEVESSNAKMMKINAAFDLLSALQCDRE